MKKRIISMILALSMMLSILPVSAFADTGGGTLPDEVTPEMVEQTNEVTDQKDYSYETVATTTDGSRIVTIKMGTDGLPLAAAALAEGESFAGTGWSYTKGGEILLDPNQSGNEDFPAGFSTEYHLNGEVSPNCNIHIAPTSSTALATLRDVTSAHQNELPTITLDGYTGEYSNAYSAYLVGAAGFNVVLNNGTVEDSILRIVTMTGGQVNNCMCNAVRKTGGQINSALLLTTQGLNGDDLSNAHPISLPANCTLNGFDVGTEIPATFYLYFNSSWLPTSYPLQLKLHSTSGKNYQGWAVASAGSAMALPAGISDYTVTNSYHMTLATISVSADGRDLSAEIRAVPTSADNTLELSPLEAMDKPLTFTAEGLPDLDGVSYVESKNDGRVTRSYLGDGWRYNCYPDDPGEPGTVYLGDQGGKSLDLRNGSMNPLHADIQCSIQISNATVTDACFGENGRMNLSSGTITGGTFNSVSLYNGTATGGTFDSLFVNSLYVNGAFGQNTVTGVTCDFLHTMGNCDISHVVVVGGTSFSTYSEYTVTISDSAFPEAPDANVLADGQKVSRIVVRNGNITAVNGMPLNLSQNLFYLVGNGSADLTLDTDVLSINDDADLTHFNNKTSAEGKVLHLTGNNDGADILVNKSTDAGSLKPLRITSEGKPDLTGVEEQHMVGEGMDISLWEGLGWKYATVQDEDEDTGESLTVSQILLTSPDGGPVDLMDSTINPTGAALTSDAITLMNVTIVNATANSPVQAEHSIIEGGTYNSLVRLYENSQITGGCYNGGASVSENCKITGGVFSTITLSSNGSSSDSEPASIENATILDQVLLNYEDCTGTISNSVSRNAIDSRFLASGQQQTKLTVCDDGAQITAINGYASIAGEDLASVYLIGNVTATLTSSTDIQNINGSAVSNYNGASASGKTLTITAKNDGDPILVNGSSNKLPFSSLTQADFDVKTDTDGTITVTPKDPNLGVGTLSAVYKRTRDGAEFVNQLPGTYDYGRYNVYIRGEEGEKYQAGSTIIMAGVARWLYKPTASDFTYDAEKNALRYTSYYSWDDLTYTVQYAPEGTADFTSTVPTEPGRYDVYADVSETENYAAASVKVGTFVVAEPAPTYTLKVTGGGLDIAEQHNAGDPITVKAPALDRKIFNGWTAEGLDGVVTAAQLKNAELAFAMPAGSVTLTANYIDCYSITFDDTTTVTANDKTIASGDLVQPGTLLTIKANYDSTAKKFDGWQSNLELSDSLKLRPEITVVMPTHDAYINASYTDLSTSLRHLQYNTSKMTIYKKVSETYSEEVSSGTFVAAGTELIVYIKDFDPSTQILSSWTINCDEEETIRPYLKNQYTSKFTFPMPDAGLYISNIDIANTYLVTYDPNTVTVTRADPLTNQDTGEVIPSGSRVEEFHHPTENSVAGTLLIAKAKYDPSTQVFRGWKVNGDTYSGTNTMYHEWVSKDVDFAAIVYDKDAAPYTLTFKSSVTFTEPISASDEHAAFDNTVTITNAETGEEVKSGRMVFAGTKLRASVAYDSIGQVVKNWDLDGVDYTEESDGSITFTMPSKELNAVASVQTKVFTLGIVSEMGSYGSSSKRGYLDPVTVTAPQQTSYLFDHWECTAGSLPEGTDTTKETISFAMPAGDVELTACYKPDPSITYTITATNAEITLSSGSDLNNVPAGTKVTATAKYDTSKEEFTFWTVTGVVGLTEEQLHDPTLTFEMPVGNVTLTANTTARTTFTVTVNGEAKQYEVGDVVNIEPAYKAHYDIAWEVQGVSDEYVPDNTGFAFVMPDNDVVVNYTYVPHIYELKAEDFRYDPSNNSITYLYPAYPQPDTQLLYQVNGELTAEVPDAPGSYPVFVRVAEDLHHKAGDFEVGTYTVDKIPFSTLTPANFALKDDESGKAYVEVLNAEGVGALRVVFEGKDTGLIYTDEFPAEPGPYTVTVYAQEGDRYTSGSLKIKDDYCIRLKLNEKQFTYSPDSGEAVYNGSHADKLDYTVLYQVNGELTETKPTADGTYPVFVHVNRTNYFTESEFQVGEYTVASLYRLVVDGSNVSLTVDGKTYEGRTGIDLKPGTTVTVTTVPEIPGKFLGWQLANGHLPDVTEEQLQQTELTFTMPAEDVELTAAYDSITSSVLTVNNGTIDESVPVYKDNHVREYTLVLVHADQKEGYTFIGWEADGLDGVVTDADLKNADLTFRMPDRDVTLTAVYRKDSTDSIVDGDTIKLPEVPADGTPVINEEEGWAIKKDEVTGKTTMSVGKGDFLTGKTLDDEHLELVLEQGTTVSGLTTSADVTLKMGSTLESGTYSGDVTLTSGSTISGGTYTGKVSGDGEITGGVFTEEPAIVTTTTTVKVTVTGGSTINELPQDIDSVFVATAGADQTIDVAYRDDTHDFYGWNMNDELLSSTEAQTSLALAKGEHGEVTLTPVVVMNHNDLTAKVDSLPAGTEYTTADFESKVAGVTVTEIRYYSADGSYTTTYPTAAGTYAVHVAVGKANAENAIALYAAEDAIVTDKGIGYYLPIDIDTGKTVTIGQGGSDEPASGGDDGGLAIVAVAAVGTVAVGVGGYVLGTTAYLKSVLPEGVAIPTNREQLAAALWTAAGKPETASTVVFNDVPADSANLTAIRWAVESGLLTADGQSFQPSRHVSRMEVIRVWKNFQQR